MVVQKQSIRGDTSGAHVMDIQNHELKSLTRWLLYLLLENMYATKWLVVNVEHDMNVTPFTVSSVQWSHMFKWMWYQSLWAPRKEVTCLNRHHVQPTRKTWTYASQNRAACSVQYVTNINTIHIGSGAAQVTLTASEHPASPNTGGKHHRPRGQVQPSRTHCHDAS